MEMMAMIVVVVFGELISYVSGWHDDDDDDDDVVILWYCILLCSVGLSRCHGGDLLCLVSCII